MVTGSRAEFLRLARLHRQAEPTTPIRVIREMGWHPSLFSYDDGSHPTVVTAAPVVYITYLTWRDKEPVMFREMFGGVISVDSNTGSVEVVLEDSLHDWLIANANEVHKDYDGEHVRVYPEEPDRELEFQIDMPTSLVQKM